MTQQIFCSDEKMSNHFLHFHCGQKVFCGCPQQQMSSLCKLIQPSHCPQTVSHQAVQIIEFIFPPSLTPFSLTCFSSLQSVSFFSCLLQLFSSWHVAFCLSALKEVFSELHSCALFSPFVKLQLMSYFTCLFLSSSLCLLFFSCLHQLHLPSLYPFISLTQ